MSRLYLSKPCAFSTTHCTWQCGRSQRPAFLAPSKGSEGQSDSKARTLQVARLRTHVPPFVVSAKARTPTLRPAIGRTSRKGHPCCPFFAVAAVGVSRLERPGTAL